MFSGRVDYRGRGVFFDLGRLGPGDIVEIDWRGETLRYSVAWRQRVSARDADWASIFSADVPRDSATLITGAGEFDFQTRSYLDRLVIRIERK